MVAVLIGTSTAIVVDLLLTRGVGGNAQILDEVVAEWKVSSEDGRSQEREKRD
jgi:hypothetical protein